MTPPFAHPLEEWGYDAGRHDAFTRAHQGSDLEPGRVVRDHRGYFRVRTAGHELIATVSGRLKHAAAASSDLPAVGDFVAVRSMPAHGRGVITGILPRTTTFRRRAAGDAAVEQVVATNVDLVFVVTGLDGDFSVRRLERYLVLVRESGARGVILLNKSDVNPEAELRFLEAARVDPECPVHLIAAKLRTGLEALEPYLVPGRTIAFLGSSGAGKSTLINALLGEERQATREVREFDSRGRHTTTERQMFRLRSGALAIDTPGMRELQLWTADDDLGTSFADVVALGAGCRFRDCRHASEPGCAVAGAVASGGLDRGRYDSYQKLRDELEATHRAKDERSRKKREKLIGRALNKFQKDRR